MEAEEGSSVVCGDRRYSFFLYLCTLMFISMLKALLVGVILAVPVGPVLFFVIQKTMCDGRRAGLFSGLGSACADTLYATVGIYALGLVRNFIDRNTPVIMIVGGTLILLVGLNMLRSRIDIPEGGKTKPDDKSGLWYSAQTLVCALSNPTALAVAMGVLAVFHLDSASLTFPAWILIPFIFTGEMLYWSLLTFGLQKFLHLTPRVLQIMSRIAGGIIAALGIFLAVKGLIMILQ